MLLLPAAAYASCMLAGTSADSTACQPKDTLLSARIKEVTVTGKRRGMIVREDRISYLPSAMVTGSQSNVYEFIRSIPGITVSSGGGITFNGVMSVAVHIDGRKSILSGEALLSYLRSVPASDFEKIDVMNHGGAQSEGTEPSMIINLRKKRNKSDGYSVGANVDGQIGKARKAYESVHAEYVRKAHSIAVNLSNLVAHNPSELFTDRPYLDYSERLTQEYERKRKDVMHYVAASYDYKPKANLAMGASMNYNYFSRTEPAVMTTSIPFQQESVVTSNTARFVTNNLFGGAYLKQELSAPESHLLLACDFFRHTNSKRQFMEDNAGNTVDGDMYAGTYGIVMTFDYKRRLSPHWAVSSGVRVSKVGMDSEDGYSESTESRPDADGKTGSLGSSFGYDENVNAAYIEGKATFGRLKLNMGMRAEQSNLSSKFSGNESAEHRDYSRHSFRLFPSLSAMFSAESVGSWMLSYSNKVARPRFNDLDPFIHIFDDITHVGGNINLQESVSHALGITWSDGKCLRVNVSGETVQGEIVKCYRELTDRIAYVTPENMPRHLRLVASVSGYNVKISPWWLLSATAGMVYSYYRFPDDMNLEPNVLFTPLAEMKNAFTLPWQISAELNVSFKGRLAYGQARTSSYWNTSLYLKKSFYKGRLSVSVYAKDLFDSNHFNSIISLAGRQAILYEKEFESMRKVGVSLSFHLSGGVRTSKKDGRKSWINEMERVTL